MFFTWFVKTSAFKKLNVFCLDTKNTINFFRSGKDLNPVVELFFGESNVEGVYEGEFICVTWVCSLVMSNDYFLLTEREGRAGTY